MVTTGWEGILVASSGEKPGVLLNILQCSGQPPYCPHTPSPSPTENSLAQNVIRAEVEKPSPLIKMQVLAVGMTETVRELMRIWAGFATVL